MIHEKRVEQDKCNSSFFSLYEIMIRENYKVKFVDALNKLSSLCSIKNRELESIKYIRDLHIIVEGFTSNDNLGNIVEVFVNYTKLLTKSSLSFFWLENKSGENVFMINIEKHNEDLNLAIQSKIKSLYDNFMDMEDLFEMKVYDDTYLVSVVKSNSGIYGAVGIKKNNFINNFSIYKKQLSFLSELSGRTFERLDLEKRLNHIMLIEEQNRIADEMHDTVAQELFSMVCGIHNVIENLDTMNEGEVREELQIIKNTARYSLSELRNAICRLSSKKKKEKSFYLEIKDYLNILSHLNSVDINLNMKGDEYSVSCHLKQALYRIICEASGNAIRHGKCTTLNIDLIIKNDCIKLFIADNGIGFNYSKIDLEKSMGLGIYNMKNLTKAYNGTFNITSELNRWTTIDISIPILSVISNDKEEIAL